MNTNNLRLDIGNRIREARLSAGYTQEAFAELIDISVNFVSEIENGKKGMSQETLYKLCKNLQLSADFILFGSDPEPIPHDLVNLVNALPEKKLNSLIKYASALQEMRISQNEEDS